jgi:F-type H+-transporting ATPase subunit delta
VLVDRIAVRYARSLYEFAQEKNQVAEVLETCQRLERMMAQTPELMNFLRSPIITHVRKKPILQKVFEPHVEPLMLSYINTLTERGRESLLPNITAAFVDLYNQANGILVAELVTTHHFEPALKMDISQKLEKLVNKKIVLKERLDPDILGGFQIRFGSTILDASVQNDLRRIRKEFKPA